MLAISGVQAISFHPLIARHLSFQFALCAFGEVVDRRLQRQFPEREFVFVHTSRGSLRIEERRWIGISVPEQ